MATPLETARQIKKLTGSGGDHEGSLPKGPARAERELLELYDRVESRVRRLPAGLPWQRITVERTPNGLSVLVTV